MVAYTHYDVVMAGETETSIVCLCGFGCICPLACFVCKQATSFLSAYEADTHHDHVAEELGDVNAERHVGDDLKDAQKSEHQHNSQT